MRSEDRDSVRFKKVEGVVRVDYFERDGIAHADCCASASSQRSIVADHNEVLERKAVVGIQPSFAEKNDVKVFREIVEFSFTLRSGEAVPLKKAKVPRQWRLSHD